MRKFILLLAVTGLVFAGSFRDLYPYLVDLPGWQAEKPEGSMQKVPFLGVAIVEAHRNYTKGEAEVKVTVGKGKGIMAAWAPFAMSMEYEDEHGWRKVENIGGFQVGIQYDKDTKSGTVVVRLMMGEETVGILELEYNNISPEEALSLTKKFDWKKIASVLKSI